MNPIVQTWWNFLPESKRMELCRENFGHTLHMNLTSDGINQLHERAARAVANTNLAGVLKFEQPQIVTACMNGNKYLFASESFLNQFPELLTHVYKTERKTHSSL